MCILLVETKKNILFIPIDWQDSIFYWDNFDLTRRHKRLCSNAICQVSKKNLKDEHIAGFYFLWRSIIHAIIPVKRKFILQLKS